MYVGIGSTDHYCDMQGRRGQEGMGHGGVRGGGRGALLYCGGERSPVAFTCIQRIIPPPGTVALGTWPAGGGGISHLPLFRPDVYFTSVQIDVL
jgi:hypothetical protein